jgi:transcriptional regulator with XRE-family HTH domain
MVSKTTNRLRVLRAEKRIPQEVLAHHAGIKPSRYWRIEHGLKDPTDDECRALARVLGVRRSDLGFAAAMEARA